MFTKKRIIVFLLITFLIIVITILFIINLNKQRQLLTPTPTGKTQTGVSYNNLTPGASSLNEIRDTLGTPVKQTQISDTTTLEYKSNNPNFNNKLILKSDILSLVKQKITSDDNTDVNSIEQKYGKYEKVFYGSSSPNGFNLYVYLTKGIAYIGNQTTKDVTEIWYFPPTDLKTFKTSYGQDYSESFSSSGQ